MKDNTSRIVKEQLHPFKALIMRFSDKDALADDMGVKVVTVRQWGNRHNIPSRYWAQLVDVAPKHGVNVTLADLADMAATPSTEASAA